MSPIVFFKANLFSMLILIFLAFSVQAKTFVVPLVDDGGGKRDFTFQIDAGDLETRSTIGSIKGDLSAEDIKAFRTILDAINRQHKKGSSSNHFLDVDMGTFRYGHYRVSISYDNKFRSGREVKLLFIRYAFGTITEKYSYFLEVGYLDSLIQLLTDAEVNLTGRAGAGQKEATEKIVTSSKAAETEKMSPESKPEEKTEPAPAVPVKTTPPSVPAPAGQAGADKNATTKDTVADLAKQQDLEKKLLESSNRKKEIELENQRKLAEQEKLERDLKQKIEQQKTMDLESQKKIAKQQDLERELQETLKKRKALEAENQRKILEQDKAERELKASVAAQKKLDQELKVQLAKQKELEQENQRKLAEQKKLDQELKFKLAKQKELEQENQRKIAEQKKLDQELQAKVAKQKEIEQENQRKLAEQRKKEEEARANLAKQKQLEIQNQRKLAEQKKLEEEMKAKLAKQKEAETKAAAEAEKKEKELNKKSAETKTKVATKPVAEVPPAGNNAVVKKKIQWDAEEAPPAERVDELCYKIGYKYGKCQALKKRGQTCSKDIDISIPERCKNRSETDRGMREATNFWKSAVLPNTTEPAQAQ